MNARKHRSSVWIPILDQITRSYHVATPEEPFQIDLADPT
jgi:hypothetical protein